MCGKKELTEWIRNDERKNQQVLSEIEIDGTLWVEVSDEKGVENVFAKNRTEAGKEAVSFKNELCELGSKQVYDRDGKRST